MKEIIYKNRNNESISFNLDEENKIAEVTGYDSTWLRIADNRTIEEKKEKKSLTENVTMVDFPGGPIIFIGMNLNDFLMSYKDFLTTEKRIVKNIKIEGSKTLVSYEEKPVEKKSKTSKKD